MIEQLDRCPIEATSDVIGGKRMLLNLYDLFGSTCRFGEFRRRVSTATQQMLTRQLRELERVGIVHHEVQLEVPPKVEYFLTPSAAPSNRSCRGGLSGASATRRLLPPTGWSVPRR